MTMFDDDGAADKKKEMYLNLMCVSLIVCLISDIQISLTQIDFLPSFSSRAQHEISNF